MNGVVLDISGAAVRFGDREVLSGVTLQATAGELIAVLGPNGAGKSTLVKTLLGLVPLSAGTATVLGYAPGTANRDIGYLPQRRSFDSSLAVRGEVIVRLGLDGDRWGFTPPWRRDLRRDARARVAEAIETVGATAFARRPIGMLSGGEQQRLLIAQALVRRPKLLCLDEPLDSLDLPNQVAVSALVARICREHGVTVLLVAHDVNPILPWIDRVVYVARGHAIAGRPEEVITAPTLSDLYGAPVEVLRCADGRLVVVGQPEAPALHGDRHAGGE